MRASRLVEEAEDLSTGVLPPGLLVVHDTSRGGQNDVAERTGGEQLRHDGLELAQRHVVPGGDAGALVHPAEELDDNLAGTVVVDDLELADVAWNEMTQRRRSMCQSMCDLHIEESHPGERSLSCEDMSPAVSRSLWTGDCSNSIDRRCLLQSRQRVKDDTGEAKSISRTLKGGNRWEREPYLH